MSGRKPVNREPVRAFVLANPSRGLTVSEIASATGVSQRATDYVLFYLCNTGEVAKLKRGMIRLFFGAEAYAEAYDRANPYAPKERKKHGYGRTPARRQAILKYMRQHPGESAAVVALGIGVAKETVRMILLDMRKDGEAFAYGTQKRPHWYASLKEMEAAQAVVRAAEESRKAASKKRMGRPRVERNPSFEIAPRTAAGRIVAAKQPATVVGMDKARKTEAVTYPPHRFWVDPKTHKGKFGSLRIGEYLTADEA